METDDPLFPTISLYGTGHVRPICCKNNFFPPKIGWSIGSSAIQGLFDALDVNNDGVLFLSELEGLFEMLHGEVS